MKKLIVMFLLVVAAVVSAQTKADSTEVNQLNQKIEQLKTQIITQEAQLYEGEKNLKQLVDQYQITQYALDKKKEIIDLKKTNEK